MRQVCHMPHIEKFRRQGMGKRRPVSSRLPRRVRPLWGRRMYDYELSRGRIMDLYYTVSQAATCLGCSTKTVQSWISQDKILAEKDGSKYKIPPKEVHKMASMMVGRR